MCCSFSGGPPLPLGSNSTGTYEIEIEDLSPTDRVPTESGCVYDSGLGEGSVTQWPGLHNQGEAVGQRGKLPRVFSLGTGNHIVFVTRLDFRLLFVLGLAFVEITSYSCVCTVCLYCVCRRWME